MIDDTKRLEWALTQLLVLAGQAGVGHTGNESLQDIKLALTNAGLPTSVGFAPATDTWGDGSTGAMVLDGTTTVSGIPAPVGNVYSMTLPIFPTTLVINSGVTLKTNNWPVVAKTSIVNNGTIDASGNAGTAAGVGGTSTAGLYASGAGGAGSTSTGAVSGGLGAGYGCGASGAGGAGASGAGGAAPSNQLGSWPYRLMAALRSGQSQVNNTAVLIGQGKGGAGGGGDSTNKGGGGGASGGLVVLISPSIKNNGTITVQGGAGGTPTTGNCGGGGGGGGGCIVAVSALAWTAGTRTLTGGAAGTGVGTGVAGGAGAVGNAYNIVVG